MATESVKAEWKRSRISMTKDQAKWYSTEDEIAAQETVWTCAPNGNDGKRIVVWRGSWCEWVVEIRCSVGSFVAKERWKDLEEAKTAGEIAAGFRE